MSRKSGYRTMKTWIIYSLSILLIYPQVTLAMTCFQKSPSYRLQGKKYFNPKFKTLSPAQEKSIANLTKQLLGKWEGSIVETECKGVESSPNVDINSISAKIKISAASHGKIRIDLNKYYKNDKRYSDEVLELLNPRNITAINLFKDRVTSTETYRQSFVGGKSIWVEMNAYTELQDDTLTMEVARYENGHYVAGKVMRFKKQL